MTYVKDCDNCKYQIDAKQFACKIEAPCFDHCYFEPKEDL